MRTILFIIYTSLIPLVPLYGVSYYKRKQNEIKRLCCLGLFAIQSLISIACIISWLS